MMTRPSPETASRPTWPVAVGLLANVTVTPAAAIIAAVWSLGISRGVALIWIAGLGTGVILSAAISLVAAGRNRRASRRLALFGGYAAAAAVASPGVAFVMWQVLLGGYVPGQ